MSAPSRIQKSRIGKPRRARRGYTMLEVISATIIIGIIMAPSARLLRDTLKSGTRVETTNVLATLGVSKLEEQLGIAASEFRNETVSDAFTAEGYPELRFNAQRTQTRAAGGIPGFLMAVTVTVWHDEDGDARLDQDEPRLQFVGKVSQP